MATFTTDDFQDIRVLIAASLTAEVLPDAQIARPIYLGRAKREIYKRLNTTESVFSTLPTDTQERGKVAMKYLTASYCLLSIRDIVSQDTLDEVIQYEKYAVADKIKAYEKVADDEVPPTTPGQTGVFTRVGVIRG